MNGKREEIEILFSFAAEAKRVNQSPWGWNLEFGGSFIKFPTCSWLQRFVALSRWYQPDRPVVNRNVYIT